MSDKKLTELIEVVSSKHYFVDQKGQRQNTIKTFKRINSIKCVSGLEKLIYTLIDFCFILALFYLVSLVFLPKSFWIFLICYISYYTFSEIIFKTTIGKRCFQLITIDEYGNELTVPNLIKRNLSRLIPFDPLSIFANRSIHDIIGQSFVITKTEFFRLTELKEENQEFKHDLNFSLEDIQLKQAIKRVDETKADIKASDYQDSFLTPIPIITTTHTINLFKGNLINTRWFFWLFMSITIMSGIYSDNVFKILLGVIIILSMFIILSLLFRRTLTVDTHGLKVSNKIQKPLQWLDFEDCLFIYFSERYVPKSRNAVCLKAILNNNTTLIIDIDNFDNIPEIGKSIYINFKKYRSNFNSVNLP